MIVWAKWRDQRTGLEMVRALVDDGVSIEWGELADATDFSSARAATLRDQHKRDGARLGRKGMR